MRGLQKYRKNFKIIFPSIIGPGFVWCVGVRDVGVARRAVNYQNDTLWRINGGWRWNETTYKTLNPYNQSKTKLIGIMQCSMNSLYMRMIWDNDIEYIGNDMGELMMMLKHSHFPLYWYTSPKHNVNIIRAA